MKLKLIKGLTIDELIEKVNSLDTDLVQFSDILHEGKYFQIVVGIPETIIEKTTVETIAKEKEKENKNEVVKQIYKKKGKK